MTPAAGSSVSAADAIALVECGALWLLDVREGYEWASGHVPGSHHIPMGELALRQDELPDDATIAVICHLGHRSRMVTDALIAANYDAVDVADGIVAWHAAGGVVVADDQPATQPSASALSGPGGDSRNQPR